MESYWQQLSSLTSEGNLQQLQAYRSLANANDALSGVYKRRPSRVTKPSSAGNSPHSLAARRRTLMAHGTTQYHVAPSDNQQYAVDPALLAASLRRKSRPMSWHPSSQHAGYPNHMTTYYSTWMDNSPCQQQQPAESFSTASFYGLPTPASQPATADPVSNLYFSSLDGSYGPSIPQSLTPSETTDIMQMDSFTWPADMLNNQCPPPYLSENWVQDPLSAGCPLSTSQIADFSQQSVPSSDEFTAPPTPDVFPSQFENTSKLQQELPTKSLAQGDELIGMGLYDEPESISLENSLMGCSNAYSGIAGKGLKLEETFSPAPENDEDDEDEEEGDSQEEEDENEDNAA